MPKATKTRINYFISYAHKNDKEVNKFLKIFVEHIQGRKKFVFHKWKDDDIIHGEDWHEQIQEAITQCDIGILLISKEFMNSTYIINNELSHFIDTKGNLKKKIFPIGIKFFDMSNSEMFGVDTKQIFFDSNKFFDRCTGKKADDFVIKCINKLETKLLKTDSNPFPNKPKTEDPKTEDFTYFKKTYSKVNPRNIIGRTADLIKLSKELRENKQLVLVNGMGGVGKTTLAAAYVFEAEQSEKYKKIIWVTENENNKDIMYDFVQDVSLLNELGIKVNTTKQAFIEILDTLRNTAKKPNLLVIDNATKSIEKYLDFLPQQPNWDLLVTSREKIMGLEEMKLGFLEFEDAILLFKKYCTTISDDNLISEIVEAFGKHTLTIEILAKMAQKQHYDANKLKNALKNNLKANIKINHRKDITVEKIMEYISSIFDLTNLAEDELWLMKQFVCLPPDFHSYDLLVEFINPKVIQKEAIFSETLENLVGNGWLIKENNSYKMHRIIADVYKNKFPIKIVEISSLINVVIDKLKIENRTKQIPQEYLPFISNFGNAILNEFIKSDNNKISVLQNNLATVLQDLGNFKGAKKLLEKALVSAEKNYGKDHPTIAVCYSNLCVLHFQLKEYVQALSYAKKALKIYLNVFGKAHHRTIQVQKDLDYIKTLV